MSRQVSECSFINLKTRGCVLVCVCMRVCVPPGASNGMCSNYWQARHRRHHKIYNRRVRCVMSHGFGIKTSANASGLPSATSKVTCDSTQRLICVASTCVTSIWARTKRLPYRRMPISPSLSTQHSAFIGGIIDCRGNFAQNTHSPTTAQASTCHSEVNKFSINRAQRGISNNDQNLCSILLMRPTIVRSKLPEMDYVFSALWPNV